MLPAPTLQYKRVSVPLYNASAKLGTMLNVPDEVAARSNDTPTQVYWFAVNPNGFPETVAIGTKVYVDESAFPIPEIEFAFTVILFLGVPFVASNSPVICTPL